MINTNGNRRPSSVVVKNGVTPSQLYAIRSFVKDGASDIVKERSFESNTGFTKEEALNIIKDKQVKNGVGICLVAPYGRKKYTVSVYVIEKAAIKESTIQRNDSEVSDKVEIHPDFMFSDKYVVNTKAKMFIDNGKIIIIQHPDEIKIFEKENKKAIFISEVDVKDNDIKAGTVMVNIVSEYRSSANHQDKLNKLSEGKFIHLKKSSAKNAVDVKVFDTKKEKYTNTKFKAEEEISQLEDNAYFAKVDGVKKVMVITTDTFTHEKNLYIFNTNDKKIENMEIVEFKNS